MFRSRANRVGPAAAVLIAPLAAKYGPLAPATHFVLSNFFLAGTYGVVYCNVDVPELLRATHWPILEDAASHYEESSAAAACGPLALACMLHKVSLPARFPVTVLACAFLGKRVPKRWLRFNIKDWTR
eukprot:gnl/MRDRNA2_/MRDRNA2_70204_c0_seq1.p1 gnl/MRDRNA2_/MRDRNA2_70204_c0~~gnl/MRDRNA2_/MRDRNA2_70204_c0_seq1.p1  ORF type:complete len:128 (+),score=8.92 gnl/MRDRNA2_/MRDRNA2_70204_c0_seq1:171-554(+)